MTVFSDDMTLRAARRMLRPMLRWKSGCYCPLCGGHAQVYRWSLYGSACVLLIRMYQVGGTTDWVESKTVKLRGQQAGASELKYWGLVENETERRPDGGRSGWWRVTDLGEEFVLKKITLPKYVDVYNGNSSWAYGPEVWITDCLGRKFDYDKMMNGDFGDD